MDAVGDRMFLENNPFEAVQGRTDLNALEKLREAIRLNQSDQTRTRWTVQAIPPHLQPPDPDGDDRGQPAHPHPPTTRRCWRRGTGTVPSRTDHPRELAEPSPSLTSLWLLPSVFPATKGEMKRKFQFLGEMLAAMGVPSSTRASGKWWTSSSTRSRRTWPPRRQNKIAATAILFSPNTFVR